MQRYFDDDDSYSDKDKDRIQQMWNMKCFILLVFAGATGIVTEKVPGKHSLDSQQQTVMLGISYIMRKVQQSEN